MANNGRITLAVLSVKLDHVLKAVEEHREEFKAHIEKDEKAWLGLDRVEQARLTTSKHFWAIYPAIVVGYVLWFMGWK